MTYSVTICTSSKATLRVPGKFTPKVRTRGARTAKPGAKQYQDKGCWPAVINVAVVKRIRGGCIAAACPTVRGVRYSARLTIVMGGQTVRTPLRRATA
jgi:hypothetical protein